MLSVAIKIFRIRFKHVYVIKTVNVKYHAIVFHTIKNYRKHIYIQRSLTTV